MVVIATILLPYNLCGQTGRWTAQRDSFNFSGRRDTLNGREFIYQKTLAAKLAAKAALNVAPKEWMDDR